MIKFKATQPNGRILIAFGLSYDDIKHLKRDQHVMFDAEELGIEGTDIMILAGDTEAAIEKKLLPQ